MEKPPEYKPPAPDPQQIALQKQADNDQIAALRVTAQMDTASLMARYGTRLAMAQAGGASAVTPATAPLLGMQAGG